MNLADTFTKNATTQPEVSVGFNAELHHVVLCQMCQATIPATNATIASVFANGCPAFACEAHRVTLRSWLLFWWRFNNAQGLVRAKELAG